MFGVALRLKANARVFVCVCELRSGCCVCVGCANISSVSAGRFIGAAERERERNAHPEGSGGC